MRGRRGRRAGTARRRPPPETELPDDVDQITEQLIARRDHPGIRLERALRADQVDEFLGDLHVRLLEGRGDDRAVALGTGGGDRFRTGVDRRAVELVAAGQQALGGGEVGDRELEERAGLAVVEGAAQDAAGIYVQADQAARAEAVLRDEVEARGTRELTHAVQLAGGAEVEGDRLRRSAREYDARARAGA